MRNIPLEVRWTTRALDGLVVNDLSYNQQASVPYLPLAFP